MINIKRYVNKKMLIVCALIITIGMPTSLAYFKDNINVQANLIIEIGRLNNEIVEGINIEGLDIKNPKSDEFELKNTGTLKQRVTFKFNNPNNIENDALDKLYYEIVFTKANGEKSKLYSGIITELFESEINIEDESGNKLILEREEVLVANIKVVMDKAMPYKYSNQNLKFDLVIDSNQINNLGN